MVSSFLGNVQRLLSRNAVVVGLSLKLRNQCAAVIAHHLGESADLERDGEAMLVRAVAPYCSTFADVGANRGEWSDVFLRTNPNAAGLLFDPAPAAFETLRKRYGPYPNVLVIQCAVGDREGEVTLYEQPDIGPESSVVAPPAGKFKAISSVVTTLDFELAARAWERLDFLKIDAEGYDCRVLQGATQALNTRRIGAIQFEYSHMWPFAGNTLAYALEMLNFYGYHTYLLTSSGLHRVNYRRYGEYFSYSNYVAVSPDWEHVVRPLIQYNAGVAS
jgi:FkbM family methyltransferase